jgi:hypothetical protein
MARLTDTREDDVANPSGGLGGDNFFLQNTSLPGHFFAQG